MSRFDAIDADALATVSGGQQSPTEQSTDGLNRDTRSRRIGVYMLGGRIPIPYRTDSTTRTRTDFGNCVDGTADQCERIGGSNATIGACKLDGIDLCTSQQPQPQ